MTDETEQEARGRRRGEAVPRGPVVARGARVVLRTPTLRDEAAFLRFVRENRRMHRPWVYAPADRPAFRFYVARSATHRHAGFLACLREGGELVGVANLSEIVLGNFRNAYLGYYGGTRHAGLGLMTEALALCLDTAFRKLRLHRVEANIQPGNDRSIALARRLGMRCEGFSPRYLKIGGRWRDHERWAIRSEEWAKARASVLRPEARSSSPRSGG